MASRVRKSLRKHLKCRQRVDAVSAGALGGKRGGMIDKDLRERARRARRRSKQRMQESR
jgi:hypothetical protein